MITIGMIVLNEAEYLGKNLAQHYGWADVIILIEGADRRYPDGNVSVTGLSTDSTAEIVRSFPDPWQKIRFIQHGWAADKCELRNRYLELAGEGMLAVLDADEFYTNKSQSLISSCVTSAAANGIRSFAIPQVHIWQPPGAAWSLGCRFIRGSYADVPHNRFYWWRPSEGARYVSNHNEPELPSGEPLSSLGRVCAPLKFNKPDPAVFVAQEPCCVHFGFAKHSRNVRDKTDYYLARGEAQTRPETSRFRAGWFDGNLPPECRVEMYGGPWPECFGGAA